MISIHAPREGSDPRGALTSRERVISIHAPREGSDLRERRQKGGAKIFQSTLPARGATTACQGSLSTFCISIHAPREGSDEQRGHNRSPLYHFNPRSPRGERPPARDGSRAKKIYFNPRSPRGERHSYHVDTPTLFEFQSTLPARGATKGDIFQISPPCNFNPRSPRGERRLS